MLEKPGGFELRDKKIENKDGNEGDPETNLKLWPDILTALKEREQSDDEPLVPPVVEKRIRALKKIQLESICIEARFHEEVHKLECKYNELLSTLYSQREDIVSGLYEPSEEECISLSINNKAVELTQHFYSKLNLEHNIPTNILGIPCFWLTVLKNIGMTNEMIQPHDEPILKHLEDIKVILKPSENMGFKLIFNFSTNEYFSNTILTKEYEMKCNRDESDPFGFEGPEIYKCKGCKIDWYKGKNVTVATIKKKQKHKDHGSIRTVMKIVPADSFFNFFNPPTLPDDGDAEVEEDIQADLTTDFEIGHYLRERVIPRAVLYYTGEALDDEEDEDFDDEDESGDEGKMESDEEEEDMEEDEEEEEGDVECKGDN
ncbi:hypothetical protein AAG570_003460 [Ranatra chinensis]|uniref:Nucleosome assembly protein 1-like 1 n=1 Tax=Ranatra chinensis TaxID=642074 RepID=A0ABD0YSA2_9HEMI